LGTVLLLSIWRLTVFGDVLPNTFWAKRWPPYAEFDLVGRLTGAVELLAFFLAPLVALELLLRLGFDLASPMRLRRHAFLVLVSPIFGAVLMGTLVLSLIFSPWVNASKGKLRVAVVVGTYLASICVSMKAFPSGELGAAFHGGTFGVSPHTYAESGRVFRRFVSAAALQRATVLTPDVGGLALCCDEFRIVDLALLSNRRLAHRGHAALAQVLEAESPEIVEAHWRWATAGRLYELPYFRAHYLPAFAGGTKLWVRRDVAEAIEREGRGCQVDAKRGGLQNALSTHRYADHDLPQDRRAFERPGVVIALREAEAAMENPCK
jgi:hypothetical protein